MKKGLLIGFTKWQSTKAYPIFEKFFKQHNVELDFLKIDEYAMCIGNGKVNLDLSQYDFCIQLVDFYHHTDQLNHYRLKPVGSMCC